MAHLKTSDDCGLVGQNLPKFQFLDTRLIYLEFFKPISCNLRRHELLQEGCYYWSNSAGELNEQCD